MGRQEEFRNGKKRVCLEALRIGQSRRGSARMAGISVEAFFTWCREDKEFLAEVEKAEAECERRLVAIINEAAPKDPKAAQFILERRFGEWGWARNDNLNVSGIDLHAAIEREFARHRELAAMAAQGATPAARPTPRSEPPAGAEPADSGDD